MTTTPEETTPVIINLPLPVDVATTLTMAIAKLYPNSTFGGGSGTSRLQINIPNSDRSPEKAGEVRETLETFEAQTAADGDYAFSDISNEGVAISTPTEIAQIFLPVVEAAFEEFPDAENYLEYRFSNPQTRKQYTLLFQRNDKMTPGELREEAEKRAARAERRAEAAEQKLAEVREQTTPKVLETFAELRNLPGGSIVTDSENHPLQVMSGIVLFGDFVIDEEDSNTDYRGPYTVLREGF